MDMPSQFTLGLKAFLSLEEMWYVSKICLEEVKMFYIQWARNVFPQPIQQLAMLSVSFAETKVLIHLFETLYLLAQLFSLQSRRLGELINEASSSLNFGSSISSPCPSLKISYASWDLELNLYKKWLISWGYAKKMLQPRMQVYEPALTLEKSERLRSMLKNLENIREQTETLLIIDPK
jgi:hypothetical protein